MSMRQITKTINDEQGQLMSETVYRAYFDDGSLIVKRVDTVNGVEQEHPVMEQPWKCLNDGTRQQFVDDKDAFDWLDSVKDTIL